MSMCPWCGKFGDQKAPHHSLDDGWCKRCVREYKDWPRGDKHASGCMVGCSDQETGKLKLLFGQERNGSYSHFHGNADPGDRDSFMAALREAAEELSYCLGFPRDLITKFEVKHLKGCAWFINIGVKSRAEREAIVKKHDDHRNKGHFVRELHWCEREMRKVKWIDAVEFKNEVLGQNHGEVWVTQFNGNLRGWLASGWIHSVVKCHGFKRFLENSQAAEPTTKPMTEPISFEESEMQFVDAILKQAKMKGEKPDVWEGILTELKRYRRGLVNERGEHTWTLLHHAAKHGLLEVARRLVVEFSADPCAKENRGGKRAEEVAQEHGHDAVATLLHEFRLKAESMEELLQAAKSNGSDPLTWDSVFADLPYGFADVRNDHTFTLLHHAAECGQVEAVKRLVAEFKADPHLKTTSKGGKQARTARELAAKKGHQEVVDVLSELTKLREEDHKPMLEAILIKAKHEGRRTATWDDILAQLQLLPRGLVDERNEHTFTLLHHAAECGNLEAVNRLVHEFGADPQVKTKKGALIARELAAQEGHHKVMDALSELTTKRGRGALQIGMSPHADGAKKQRLDAPAKDAEG